MLKKPSSGPLLRLLPLLLAVVLCAGRPGPAQAANSYWDWVDTNTNSRWGNTTNWSTEVIPNASDVVVIFDDHSNLPTTSGGTVTSVQIVGEYGVGAVILGETNTIDRSIYNFHSNTPHTLTLSGVPSIIGGDTVNLLLANYSDANRLYFYTSADTQRFSLTLANSGVFHVDQADAMIQFGAPIYESVAGTSITKTGAGVLYFGTISYGTDRNQTTGGLIIKEGIVRSALSSAASGGALVRSPLGLGAVTMSGGALQSSSTAERTFHNAFILDGGGTFGAESVYTGGIVISSEGGQSTTVSSDSVLDVAGTQLSWGQTITGAGSLTKTGAGTLDLGSASQQNTYAGGFILEEGAVQTWGSGSVTGGALVSSPFGLGTLTLRGGTIQAQTTAGTRTYSNAVVVDGDVAFGRPGDTGTLAISSGAGQSTTLTGDHTVTVNVAQLTWTQTISGGYRLTKDGAGTLTYNPASASSYSGLTVKAGVLEIFGTNSWPTAPAGYQADQFVIDGGTLRIRSGNAMNSNRGMALGEAGATLEIVSGVSFGTNSQIVDLVPGEAGNLNKTGAGAFTIGVGAMGNYTGPTTVSAGAFYVDGTLTSSTVEVQAGATFGGAGLVNEEITVRAGGILAPGARTTRGGLTTYGAVSLEDGAIFRLELTGEGLGNYDSLAASGVVSLDGAAFELTLDFQPAADSVFVLIDNFGATAIEGRLTYGGVTLEDGDSFTVTSGDYTQAFTIDYDYTGDSSSNSLAIVATVPEPSSGLLVGLGTVSLIAFSRRFRRMRHLSGARPAAHFMRRRESGERIWN